MIGPNVFLIAFNISWLMIISMELSVEPGSDS